MQVQGAEELGEDEGQELEGVKQVDRRKRGLKTRYLLQKVDGTKLRGRMRHW